MMLMMHLPSKYEDEEDATPASQLTRSAVFCVIDAGLESNNSNNKIRSVASHH